ncbi:unnamed protein product, partial [Trichobilharzia regenti]
VKQKSTPFAFQAAPHTEKNRDLAQFADWLILLVPSNPSEIPDSVHELLTAIYTQGFTNASYAVLSSSSNLKELKQILECRFPVPESTVHQLNSSSNAMHLLRHIASTSPSSLHVKTKNAKVAGQSAVAHTENGDANAESDVTLCLRGRLLGAPLFLFEELDQCGTVPVGPSVHLTGWGDFPLEEARWVHPNGLKGNWKIADLENSEDFKTRDKSVNSTINMINSDEDSEEDSVSDEMSVDDSQQCVDEDGSDVMEGEPDQLQLEMSDNSDMECASIASHTAHTMAASATSAFSSAQLAKFRAARMEEMFPDEVYGF